MGWTVEALQWDVEARCPLNRLQRRYRRQCTLPRQDPPLERRQVMSLGAVLLAGTPPLALQEGVAAVGAALLVGEQPLCRAVAPLVCLLAGRVLQAGVRLLVVLDVQLDRLAEAALPRQDPPLERRQVMSLGAVLLAGTPPLALQEGVAAVGAALLVGEQPLCRAVAPLVCLLAGRVLQAGVRLLVVLDVQLDRLAEAALLQLAQASSATPSR